MPAASSSPIDPAIGQLLAAAQSLDRERARLLPALESAGFNRFTLLGMSQSGPVAICYAVRHPDRVTRLVLFGTFAARVRTAADRELLETFVSMTRVGWARPDSLFRRVFTNLLIPGASEEQMRWVDALAAGAAGEPEPHPALRRACAARVSA